MQPQCPDKEDRPYECEDKIIRLGGLKFPKSELIDWE